MLQHAWPVCDLVVWNGMLCSGLLDGLIYIWNEKEEQMTTLEGHTDNVLCLKVWNHLLCSSWDTTIRVWNSEQKCVTVLKGHTEWVFSIEVCDELLFSSSNDNTVRVWNNKFECIYILPDQLRATSLQMWNNLLCIGLYDSVEMTDISPLWKCPHSH